MVLDMQDTSPRCSTYGDYPCDLPAIAVLTALGTSHVAYTCHTHRNATLLNFADYEDGFTYRLLAN